MHEFQTLTWAQEACRKANDDLSEKMKSIFSVGATEVVIDGGGRRMPVEIKSICSGSEAGYLRVMPVNGKRTRRSLRSVHWSSIDRTEDHDND